MQKSKNEYPTREVFSIIFEGFCSPHEGLHTRKNEALKFKILMEKEFLHTVKNLRIINLTGQFIQRNYIQKLVKITFIMHTVKDLADQFKRNYIQKLFKVNCLLWHDMIVKTFRLCNMHHI